LFSDETEADASIRVNPYQMPKNGDIRFQNGSETLENTFKQNIE